MPTRNAVPVGLCCLLLICSLGAKKGLKDNGPADPGALQKEQGPLPDPVKKTVDAHYPGQAVVGFEHEVEDSRTLYFVDIKTDKGMVTLLSSGRGQYLGMVSEMPGDDDADVYIEYETAPPLVKEAIASHLTKGSDGKDVTVDALFMEVEAERFMFVAEVGPQPATTQLKTGKGAPVAGATWWTFSNGGNLVSVEKEVATKDLPAAVADSVKGRKILSANVVDDKEKKTMSYVIDVGGVAGGNDQELTLSPDGKVLSTEAVESETPAKP